MIALSQGYGPLFFGRLLQGISGGFVGIVVPLYLAECLSANDRGKGTGVFQWLLTLGIVCAAVIGIFYSYRVAEIMRTGSQAAIFLMKDNAWRRIFWMSMPPGLLFVFGSVFVLESPRWLFKRGKKKAAREALLRSRSPEQAELELKEMEQASIRVNADSLTMISAKDSLLRRKYVFPFLLACVILFCNTATGILKGLADISMVGGKVHLPPVFGYFRAKIAQEKLIKGSSIPYSIVHATQFFGSVLICLQSFVSLARRLPFCFSRPLPCSIRFYFFVAVHHRFRFSYPPSCPF